MTTIKLFDQRKDPTTARSPLRLISELEREVNTYISSYLSDEMQPITIRNVGADRVILMVQIGVYTK